MEVLNEEPAELTELSESECLRDGRECSLASVGRRDPAADPVAGEGESILCKANIG